MWISVLGIYNHDNTIFDQFILPKHVDKNILVNLILLRAAELEILYAEPELLKKYINYWSGTHAHVWEHLLETTEYTYNPIENYDRNEEWSDTESGNVNGTTSTSGNFFEHGQDKGVTQTDTENKNYNTAFNTTDLWQTDQSNSTAFERPDISFTRDGNNAAAGTDNRDTKRDSKHSGRVHGNIGTMTTQSMIEQERAVAEFNIYDRICNDFIEEFCLLNY